MQAMQPTVSFNFSALPGDMRRTIQAIVLENIPESKPKQSYKNLAHFIFVNKEFYAFANQPANTIKLLSGFGFYTAYENEITIARRLNLPGIKSEITQQWLKLRQNQINAENAFADSYNKSEPEQLIKLEHMLTLGGNFNSRSHHTDASVFMRFVCNGMNEPLTPCIEKAIALGANINLPSKDGETILSFALEHDSSSAEFIKQLLKLGANANQQDTNGKLPIALASCRPDHAELIPILMAAGANINAQNETGQTISMRLASQQKFHALEVLLAYKPDCDVQDHEGETLLMKLIRLPGTVWSAECISKVLDLNPNLSLRNAAGKTALAIAIEGLEQTEGIYVHFGREINSHDKYELYVRAIQDKMREQQAKHETN